MYWVNCREPERLRAQACLEELRALPAARFEELRQVSKTPS
jgi:hypothetical protein